MELRGQAARMDQLFLHNLVLFCHLLGALLFVAGIVLAGAPFEAARRRQRPQEIVPLLGLTRFGVLLVAVGGLMLLIFGLWLVHLDGFDYGARWIQLALALFAVAMVLGGLGGQRPKQARKLAERLASEGTAMSPQLRRLLDDPLGRAANYASALLVAAILVLMVWKPY